jgi:hypothetical protein
MSWLGQIRPHRRDEAWSASLWRTFFATCVGAKIPSLPLSACGCKKFAIDALVDHVSTCTAHSGAKKAHDWAADQIADLFRTTHKVKTQQVTRSQGSDVGTLSWLPTSRIAAGPVPLVLDLCIAHERFGSSSDSSFNGHLHYPNDLDGPLNEAAADKIRQYLADYNNRPSNAISFMPAIASTSGRLHIEFVRLLFLQAHRETTSFLKLQEFSLRNLPVACSTTAARRSPHSSSPKSQTSLPRLQLYVSL